MTSSVSNQIDGLRQLARLITVGSLKRVSSLIRESEARHLLDMLRDAAETMERADNEGLFDE